MLPVYNEETTIAEVIDRVATVPIGDVRVPLGRADVGVGGTGLGLCHGRSR